ncbi:hypothetical protein AAMO2058_000129800 [Amorphochlora amoebiformis]
MGTKKSLRSKLRRKRSARTANIRISRSPSVTCFLTFRSLKEEKKEEMDEESLLLKNAEEEKVVYGLGRVG